MRKNRTKNSRYAGDERATKMNFLYNGEKYARRFYKVKQKIKMLENS